VQVASRGVWVLPPESTLTPLTLTAGGTRHVSPRVDGTGLAARGGAFAGGAGRELLHAGGSAPRRALRASLGASAGDRDDAAAPRYGSLGGLSAVFFLAGTIKKAGGSAAPGPAADDAAAAEATKPRSRRLRTCASGVALFFGNFFAPFLPEPPPPAGPRIIVVDGVRMQADGVTPVRLPRKARQAQEVLDEQKAAMAELTAAGINPKEGMLKYMSPKRLREFLEFIDAPKKHIFRKAPKIANTLAMKLVEECSKPTIMSVALPWGPKKGNNQSATVRLKIVDPPYNPADRTPHAGQLQLVIETESGGIKHANVTGLSANTGPDNVIGLQCGAEGQLLLSTVDEPTRWKWALAINAGLHRTAAIRCMMDQAAAVMPWHPNSAVLDEEPE